MAKQTIDIGTVANDGTGNPLRTAMDKVNDNFNELYRTNVDPSSGVFHILDYGIVSGYNNNAQITIQQAIDDAYAFGNSAWGMGGTVIIPPGLWHLTGPIALKDFVNVQCHKNAYFLVKTANTERVWCVSSGTLRTAQVSGGYYKGDTSNYICVDLHSVDTNSFISGCTFSNMYITNASAGIRLKTSVGGWMNNNKFENIIIDNPVVAIDISTSDLAGGRGVNGNFFTNVSVQCGPTIQCVVDNITGWGNQFINFGIWDFEEEADYSTDKTFRFVSGSKHNIVIGYGLDASSLYNDGNDNLIISYGKILGAISNETLLIWEDWTDTALKPVNRLVLGHYGLSGSSTDPSSDIAILLNSYMSNWTDMHNANFSARIVCKNMAASNFGSQLILQTHGTASNTTAYIDTIKLGPTGDVTLYPSGIPTYANNTDASTAGLAPGRLYRTSTGQLMIRYAE